VKLLFENWRKYNENPFQLMCEQYERKVITEAQLLERWEQMVITELNELNQQLNEIDWEEEAELTADPDYKPPHERPSKFLQKGWEKFNDWVLMKSIQITEIGRTAALTAAKMISSLINKIKSFCRGYPWTCKITIAVLVVIAFYIISAYFTEAHAKLYHKKKPVPEDTVKEMRGHLYDIYKQHGKELKDIVKQEKFSKLMVELDRLHKSKTPVDITKSQEGIGKALNALWNNVENMKQGTEYGPLNDDPETRQAVLKRWLDWGSRVIAKYDVTKTPGFENVKYGMKLTGKGPGWSPKLPTP